MENLEENEELGLVNQGSNIEGFGMTPASGKECFINTNIKDKKKLFNLESSVDCLLNDCEGERINVVEVVTKRYYTETEEELKDNEGNVVVNENGEIVYKRKLTMSTVLLDDQGKSYATGSKVFGIQLLRYLNTFANRDGSIDPFTIEITKVKNNQSGNKQLGFKLI